jgi:hypothetical protein
MLYEGSEREHICDHLIPGHTYHVRVACCSAGGRSEVSYQAAGLMEIFMVMHVDGSVTFCENLPQKQGHNNQYFMF